MSEGKQGPVRCALEGGLDETLVGEDVRQLRMYVARVVTTRSMSGHGRGPDIAVALR